MVSTRSGLKDNLTVYEQQKRQRRSARDSTRETANSSTMTTDMFKDVDSVWKELTDFKSLTTFFTSLGPLSVTRFDYNGFDARAILEAIRLKCKSTKTDGATFFQDITDIILVGIARGNIRDDQISKTVEGDGAARIRALATKYGIHLRNGPNERHILAGNELTFTRSISLMPHIASLIQFTCPTLATEGFSTVLNSRELPGCMKHTGFAALIPTGVAKETQLLFLYAYMAYMIEFSMSINVKSRAMSITDLFNQQKTFCITAMEKSMYTNEVRISYLVALELNSMENFNKIVAVAGRLHSEVTKTPIDIEALKRQVIKDNVVLYATNPAAQLTASTSATL